jgi:hypothetical protein
MAGSCTHRRAAAAAAAWRRGRARDACGTTTAARTRRRALLLVCCSCAQFRNAEIRRSLVGSMDKSLGPAEGATALPPVSGTVSIKLGPGMEAEVDAAAYMSELRTEVEGLRAELAKTRESEGGGEQALIAYIQGLGRDDQQQLTNDVSSEVLEAMSQLVATILIDLNIERDAESAQAGCPLAPARSNRHTAQHRHAIPSVGAPARSRNAS